MPRTNGGLPRLAQCRDCRALFAPHTRGSTHCLHPNFSRNLAYPAHAGVYPAPTNIDRGRCNLPRTRGSLPTQASFPFSITKPAPHTRGSTERDAWVQEGSTICPAHAGVYRRWPCLLSAERVSPAHAGVYHAGWPRGEFFPSLHRKRGGLPVGTRIDRRITRSAPHPRGSTPSTFINYSNDHDCPAPAGVYPFISSPGEIIERITPLQRGSTWGRDLSRGARNLSPHTRGPT